MESNIPSLIKETCPMNAVIRIIGGKWKLPILWHMRYESRRYSELQRMLGNVTPKMLAQQLRELERDGIIHREVYPVVPPKVEYSLTGAGKTLIPVLETLGDWGRKHREEY